jgi:hypothetical protein
VGQQFLLERGLIAMRPKSIFIFLRVLCVTAACGLPVVASALFPCVRAVSSANGNFVVIVDAPFEPEQGKAPSRTISLNVLPRETFINEKDELLAPATYWTDRTIWSVVLDTSRMFNEPECPLPLITDDGEFLVLLRTGPAFAEDAVLRIFGRRDHPGGTMGEGPDQGVFNKGIPLAKLWPPTKLAEIAGLWNDGTPEWFAGGTFKFSSDCRFLIHKTRWRNTVRINLEDGSVSKE